MASGHGKGAPDAIGGAVKHQADAMVNRGCDITDANTLFHCLKKPDSAVSMHLILVAEIDSMDVASSKSLKVLAGTMKLHQLFVEDERSAAYRILSCFCSRPTMCSCYEVHRYQYDAER